MVTVAIPGGTGQVGRTITSVLKKNPKHKVIILTRKAPENPDPDVTTLVVDYNDVEAVAKILTENNVHTVISSIFVVLPDSGEAEINIVKAAAQSAPTKRFIASDWGLPRPATHPNTVRQATLAALRQTDLEFTAFHTGYFSDFYGLPHIHSYFPPSVVNIDMEARQAALPGDGNTLHAYTYSFDLAKFVEAALEVPAGEWEETTYCWSDKVTFNQIVALAEEARGGKFQVHYDALEELEKGQVTELPGHIPSYAFYPKELLQQIVSLYGLSIATGLADFPEEKSLNKKFPDIKTTSIKTVIDAWKGK